MLKRLIHICVIAMFCVLGMSAQGVVMLTSDQGLSNTCMHSISEDSYHNVWITTRNGLNMFDGAKIRAFYHNDEDSTSLLTDITTKVLELTPGKLLIGTSSGLCSFDYATDEFSSVTLHGADGHPIMPRVVDIAKRRDGSALVMVTGSDSYVVKDTPKGIVATITRDYALQGHGAIHYVEGRNGREWVVSNHHEVAFFEKGRAHPVALDGTVQHIAKGIQGNIYVDLEGKGLFKYDEGQGVFVPLPFPELSDVIIKNLRSNGEGEIYVCTDGNGLYLYHEKTGELEHSTIRTSEYDIATSNIEDAMQDKAGNLWIGIYWKGVVVQPQTESAFDYVGRRSAQKNTLGTNCITSIHPAEKGWLWVGADHCGLYHLSSDGTESKHYEPGTTANVPGTVTAIYQDRRGILWLGSSLGQLVCMDPSTGIFTPIEQLDPACSSLKKIYGIAGDNYDNVWLATMGDGLYGYNLTTHQLKHYSTPNHPSVDAEHGILSNVWTNCVVADGNSLYVGTVVGLDHFRIVDDGRLEHVGHHINSAVNDIKVDDQGVIWVGSLRGLFRLKLDQDNVDVLNISQKDGLSHNCVRSVELHYLSGHNYEVWASTDNGLDCYSPASQQVRCFYIEDGLQGNEFTEHCSAQHEGRLFFGGINGMSSFLPQDVTHNRQNASQQLRVVGLYLQGEVVRAGQKSGKYTIYQSWIDEADEFHFSHSDQNIAFEVCVTSVFQGSTYEYCLDDQGWVGLGNGQNRIVMNTLSTGNHVLRIRALEGGEICAERQLNIIMHAPWYASAWMMVIYLLIVLLILYLIYTYAHIRAREKQLNAERKQEEELAEARIQFFMNISHEIRTPMTLILAPLEKLRAMNDDDEHHRHYNLIYQNAQRILQLINQMMDVRKIEKGQFQLNYQKVEVVSFIKNLYDLFVTTSQQRNIELVYNHNVDKLEAQVDSPSLDKILMNLLSNALKFTSDGGHICIELEARPLEKSFQICVTDDGVGIGGTDKERIFKRFYSGVHKNGYIGTGIGLNLTYLLVQLHKGEIHVMDNPAGKGTRFEVLLPVCNPSDESEAVVPTANEAERSIDKASGKRHRNLLLVEDDVDIRQYLRGELLSDFSIMESGNGQDAWDYVQRNSDKVDIIITDIMMPLMGGDELCQKVKSNYNTNHIPVIMLSAKNTDADRIAGMSIGADAYMTKPFNVDLLRTTALTILQNHQSLHSRAITAKKMDEVIDDVEVVSPDEQLMDRIMACVNQNLSNPELSVELVADTVGVSRVHFHRRLKELTGQTPREFIRGIRMKQAERLLRDKHVDITDVSIATGFKSLSTFSSTFKSIYGMTPTEYMNSKKKEKEEDNLQENDK